MCETNVVKPNNRTYVLSELEQESYVRFCARHRKCKGDIWVSFGSGGGIGDTVRVHCKVCKKFCNVTDYCSW